MPSKYWLKLYHEILDDPKMGRLTDRLFRRVIQCFLLAGEADKDGYLPSMQDMVWRLRIPEEELETDFADLACVGILQNLDGWCVTKFAQRQAPVANAVRMKQYRERERQSLYNGDESVTIRNIDTDIDTEEEGKPRLPNTPKEAQNHPTIQIYQQVTNRIPGMRDYELVIDTIEFLGGKIPKGRDIVKYLTPFWTAWIGRKYKRSSLPWLTEWAVNGEIPGNEYRKMSKNTMKSLEEQGYVIHS